MPNVGQGYSILLLYRVLRWSITHRLSADISREHADGIKGKSVVTDNDDDREYSGIFALAMLSAAAAPMMMAEAAEFRHATDVKAGVLDVTVVSSKKWRRNGNNNNFCNTTY